LNSMRKVFPSVKYMNLGGGLGVAYKEDQNDLVKKKYIHKQT